MKLTKSYNKESIDLILFRANNKQIMKLFMEDYDDRFKELWLYREISG